MMRSSAISEMKERRRKKKMREGGRPYSPDDLLYVTRYYDIKEWSEHEIYYRINQIYDIDDT